MIDKHLNLQTYCICMFNSQFSYVDKMIFGLYFSLDFYVVFLCTTTE